MKRIFSKKMSNNSKTIQIFLPDGDPKGIKIATIRIRNIEVISFSRNNLEALYKVMENRSRVGIYFLIGFNENKGQNEVYVGEAEDIIVRLKQHNNSEDKDFWQKGYFVITNTGFFTKSHIKYLENFLYNKIKEADKILLHNGNEPTKSYIDETIEADLNGDIYECIEVLVSLLIGDNIFEKIDKKSNKKTGDVFICKDTKGNYAEGKYLEDGFLVFKGAKINLNKTKSFGTGSENRTRDFLIENNLLVKEKEHFILNKDYLFNSPSLAGAIILGMRVSGWLWWKNKEGKTLDEIYRNNPSKK